MLGTAILGIPRIAGAVWYIYISCCCVERLAPAVLGKARKGVRSLRRSPTVTSHAER
jgi:hypothetical protein